MQSQIKNRIKYITLLLSLLFFSHGVFADKGQKSVELLLGATVNDDLPAVVQASYLYGFNELTDLSIHVAADYSASNKVFELGVGSFYTQRIGDISPQIGLTVGPRIYSVNNTELKYLFIKTHFRAVFELESDLHLIGEYSPGIELGQDGGFFHQIKIGVRF